MSTSNAVNAGMYSKLAAGTALTALLAGTTSIYYLQAPSNATLPYVVFNQQAGGPDNDSPIDDRSLVYYVRGYAVTPALAGSIDAQCSALLHRQSLTVSGYTNFWLARETDLQLVETPPTGEEIYSAGATYRIRLTV